VIAPGADRDRPGVPHRLRGKSHRELLEWQVGALPQAPPGAAADPFQESASSLERRRDESRDGGPDCQRTGGRRSTGHEPTEAPAQAWYAFGARRRRASLTSTRIRGPSRTEAALCFRRRRGRPIFRRRRRPGGGGSRRWRSFVPPVTATDAICFSCRDRILLPAQAFLHRPRPARPDAVQPVLGLRQEVPGLSGPSPALHKMMIIKSRVLRDRLAPPDPGRALVPGEHRRDRGRDVVPADGRLLAAATLEWRSLRNYRRGLPVTRRRGPLHAPTPTRLPDRHGLHEHERPAGRRRGSSSPATVDADRVGHISHMLQARRAATTPLPLQLQEADQPDPVHLRSAVRTISSSSTRRAARASTRSSPRRSPSQLRRSRPGSPRRPRRSSRRHADARQGERDHEAVCVRPRPLGSTSRSTRTRRGPDAQPDDCGELTIPAPLRDLGHRLRDRGRDQACLRPARCAARAVPAADGALRRRGPVKDGGLIATRRRAHSSSRREGRPLRSRHPRAYPRLAQLPCDTPTT